MRVTVRGLNSYEENDKVKVKEKKSSSLIEGNIGKAILLFVLPLIAGSLIQQLYVTVDAIIVGRFAGKVGLAAIDSINTLFKFPINFMNGLAAEQRLLFPGISERKLPSICIVRSVRRSRLHLSWESSVLLEAYCLLRNC